MFERWPVSTNVIFQLSMSLWSRSMVRPPLEKTKSFDRHSS